MSYGLVLNTVVDHLRTQLTLDYKQVSLQPNGQPPPELTGFPTYFLGVCGTSYQAGPEGEESYALHEVFGFKVVVSVKITHKPMSQYAAAYAPADVLSLYAIARRVMLKLHDNMTWLGVLNTGLTNKYISTPKWLETTSEPIVKTGDWLHVDPENEKAMYPACLVAEVGFGGVERIQCLSDSFE